MSYEDTSIHPEESIDPAAQQAVEGGAEPESASADNENAVTNEVAEDREHAPVDDHDLPDEPAAPVHKAQSRRNFKFAEMRKARETAEQMAKEANERIQQMETQQRQTDAFYAQLAQRAGVKGVENEAQYREMLQNQLEAKRSGLSPQQAALNAKMNRLASQVDEINSRPTAEALIQNMNPDSNPVIRDELDQFREATGIPLKSIYDIRSLPNAPQVVNYMRDNGLSLTDSYRLANADMLAQEAKAATKQQAINSLRGHQHVSDAAGSSQVDDYAATPADLAWWRNFNPGVSDKDLTHKIVAAKRRLGDT